MKKTSRTTLFVAAALPLALVGCKKKPAETKDPVVTGSGSAATTGSAGSAGATAGSDGSAMATGSDGSGAAGSAAGSGSATAGDRMAIKDVGFMTPESVLHDADADVYLVSNINGKPTDADDNGFISKLSPDGKVTELKWIDGAKDDVKLDAPKGTAIVDGTLYVADITVVRQFDYKTGKQGADIKVEGASFLNDIVAAPGGGVYVTDTGLDPSFKPTGADAVHKIGKDGKVTAVIKNKELGGPNGVAVAGDTIWVNTFGSGEVYQVNAKGEKQPAVKAPKGQLDGMAVDGDTLYVSSWEAGVIYKLTGGKDFAEVVTDVVAPADFGWDAKRKKFLVPLFNDNQVVIVSPK